MKKSQEYLKNRLNPIEPISATSYLLEDDNSQLSLELSNKILFPLEIISVKLNGKTYIPIDNSLMNRKKQFKRINYKKYKFKLLEENKNDFLSKDDNQNEVNTIKYKIHGISKEHTQSLKVFLGILPPSISLTIAFNLSAGDDPSYLPFESILLTN